ncbi:hypothetical protein R6Q57_006101 [Mikania cordata]
MSSSMIASHVIIFATTMAAVSGTLFLLALRNRKQPTTTVAPNTIFSTTHNPRPCISIDGKKRVKKKKKVRFAEDVMEPRGSGDEFRKRHRSKNPYKLRTGSSLRKDQEAKRIVSMPVNRIVLYTGILRNRDGQRFAHS